MDVELDRRGCAVQHRSSPDDLERLELELVARPRTGTVEPSDSDAGSLDLDVDVDAERRLDGHLHVRRGVFMHVGLGVDVELGHTAAVGPARIAPACARNDA